MPPPPLKGPLRRYAPLTGSPATSRPPLWNDAHPCPTPNELCCYFKSSRCLTFGGDVRIRHRHAAVKAFGQQRVLIEHRVI